MLDLLGCNFLATRLACFLKACFLPAAAPVEPTAGQAFVKFFATLVPWEPHLEQKTNGSFSPPFPNTALCKEWEG